MVNLEQMALAALLLALPSARAKAKPSAKMVKVHYLCKDKKKLSVSYQLSAKGLPVTAAVTLESKPRQLASIGKANRYTINFAQGAYALSLDRSKLPVTKAPIMVFKTIPAAKIKKADPKAPKAKAALSKLKSGTSILFRGCSPRRTP